MKMAVFKVKKTKVRFAVCPMNVSIHEVEIEQVSRVNTVKESTTTSTEVRLFDRRQSLDGLFLVLDHTFDEALGILDNALNWKPGWEESSSSSVR